MTRSRRNPAWTSRTGMLLRVAFISALIGFAGAGSASAQFSIGGGRDGGRDDVRHGDDRHGGGGVGLGVGIGIGVGRAILENSQQQETNTPGGSTTTRTKQSKRARKGDDPPAGGKPPKTVTKDGDKKDKKKKGDPKDPSDNPKGDDPKDVAIDDCIVILQYGNRKDGKPRIPTREEDPTSAQNEDIKGSAELVAKNSPGSQTGTVTDADGHHLEDVIKGFKTKGCCKRIQIFGHGTPTGQLQLPYEIGEQTGASDTLGGFQKANMHGDDADAWNGFAGALKSALCPDPKGKPGTNTQVRINACWSAKTDGNQTPIASELSKEGIRTSGWTGVVDFNDGEKAQNPSGHDDSKQTEFSASSPDKK